MYAKLVCGGADIPAIGAMRDMVALLTSGAPSLSDLLHFDTDASLIIDDTPAGWTYAGGSGDDNTSLYTTDATVNDITVNTFYTIAVSAPCIDSSKTKYAAFNIVWLNATQSNNNRFALIGAEFVDTDGTMTNGGGLNTWGGGQGEGEGNTQSHLSTAGTVFHLVANERGIVLVEEARGMSMVCETNETSVHTFYDQAPFVQYSHPDSSRFSKAGIYVVDPAGGESVTATSSGITTVFNVRDVESGVLYGTYDPTSGSSSGDNNRGSLWQNAADIRKTSISDNGLPLYQVSPVFFQVGTLGYPVQYVTGVFPMYWTAPNIGTSGDTIQIATEDYIWFNAGTGFGVAMQTS